MGSMLFMAVTLGGCTAYAYDCYYYYGYYYPYCDYYYMYGYLPTDGYTQVYSRSVVEEPVPNPDPTIAPQSPDASLNVINFTYLARTSIEGDSEATLQRLRNDYPCGGNDTVQVICQNNDDISPGDFLLLAYQLEQPVPYDDSVNFFVLGFSFDRDNDPGNNFQPEADEMYDYFGGTDKWIAAYYEPTDGWRLEATEYRDDAPASVSTDARVIFEGDTVALIVPASEFQSAIPGSRVSLFRHTGEFGADGSDWAGVVFPRLDEPLAGP